MAFLEQKFASFCLERPLIVPRPVVESRDQVGPYCSNFTIRIPETIDEIRPLLGLCQNLRNAMASCDSCLPTAQAGQRYQEWEPYIGN